mmetsp:Transcript_7788/g.11762  ORF Transcript_7788/g.11762 Transcript_7788/m.11762 type:complete len:83 (+) Transcript_7788:740-988(+)
MLELVLQALANAEENQALCTIHSLLQLVLSFSAHWSVEKASQPQALQLLLHSAHAFPRRRPNETDKEALQRQLDLLFSSSVL